MLAGKVTTLWEMRIVLDAEGRKLPAQAILAPQLTQWVSHWFDQ